LTNVLKEMDWSKDDAILYFFKHINFKNFETIRHYCSKVQEWQSKAENSLLAYSKILVEYYDVINLCQPLFFVTNALASHSKQ